MKGWKLGIAIVAAIAVIGAVIITDYAGRQRAFIASQTDGTIYRELRIAGGEVSYTTVSKWQYAHHHDFGRADEQLSNTLASPGYLNGLIVTLDKSVVSLVGARRHWLHASGQAWISWSMRNLSHEGFFTPQTAINRPDKPTTSISTAVNKSAQTAGSSLPSSSQVEDVPDADFSLSLRRHVSAQSARNRAPFQGQASGWEALF